MDGIRMESSAAMSTRTVIIQGNGSHHAYLKDRAKNETACRKTLPARPNDPSTTRVMIQWAHTLVDMALVLEPSGSSFVSSSSSSSSSSVSAVPSLASTRVQITSNGQSISLRRPFSLVSIDQTLEFFSWSLLGETHSSVPSKTSVTKPIDWRHPVRHGGFNSARRHRAVSYQRRFCRPHSRLYQLLPLSRNKPPLR
jgi:hypothetical protein